MPWGNHQLGLQVSHFNMRTSCNLTRLYLVPCYLLKSGISKLWWDGLSRIIRFKYQFLKYFWTDTKALIMMHRKQNVMCLFCHLFLFYVTMFAIAFFECGRWMHIEEPWLGSRSPSVKVDITLCVRSKVYTCLDNDKLLYIES